MIYYLINYSSKRKETEGTMKKKDTSYMKAAFENVY